MDGVFDGDTVGSHDGEVVGVCDGNVDGTNDMDGVIVGVEDTVVGVCVTDGAAVVDFIFFLDFDFFFLELFLLRFFDFFDFGTLVLGAFVSFGDDGDNVFLFDGAIGGFLSPSFFLSNGRSDPPPPAFAFAASEVVLVDEVVVAVVPVDIPAHSFVHASISSRWSKSKSSQVIARPCNLFLANNSRLPVVVLLLLLLLIRPLTLPLPVLPVPVLPIAALTPIIDEDETTTTTTSCSNSKLFN